METIFVGKQRLYNRRFLQMCSHYLVEPVACTPASGWEKGQVENQVGLVRERFFTPRLRFKSLEELNAWLLDQCIAYANAHRHPALTDQTIWDVFEAERPKLVRYTSRFDGFHSVPASVSKTCLVRFDNNKYSVAASAVGRPVEVHAYADRIVIRQDRGSSPNIPARSAAGIRSTTLGTTSRYSPASQAPCATALPSRIGCCQPRWSAYSASSLASMTAIGRWSTSSPRCSPTDCRRSKPPALRQSSKASTPLTSSSTFSLGSAIPPGPPTFSRQPR